jgi:hypothetical protein
MWSAKTELAKKSIEIAREKYPEGFNKKKIIECSKEVYGGFGETQASPRIHKKIVTHEDVNNMGNAMAQIDGGYPVGMSTCMIVGINGGCGLDCPAYLDGECGEPQEFKELNEEEIEQHIELYGEYTHHDIHIRNRNRVDG